MNFLSCSKGHQVPFGARFCQQCGELLSIVESKTAEATRSENGLEQLLPGNRLRDRYVILQQLGQGGFGKTYLAEDTGRFHEKIVIKEFVPTVQGTHALEKAEELFEREAVTLHQLQHPQIPRFWETFREGKRLFLVEDFIEGQTYQSLLEQRLQQGQCFRETEILQLLRELLPVLNYLHRQGVIHRDISPDNIMLRSKDKQVVLIDMGGVKQVAIDVATQVAGVRNRVASSTATCLGKVGYAPDEQLRLGIVAPYSDLYALAVTAIVLMTGKQPQELLDQRTLNWNWHQELTLSPLLTKILNQMLHRQPSQRFKSADEILQLLQSNSSSRTYAATKPTELLQSNSSSRTYAANKPTEFRAIAPVNNSGQGGIVDSSIKVPDEIKGWNWGSALLPLFWCFPNRVWIGLLFLTPVLFLPQPVSFGMAAIFGMNGNKWAWKSRRWDSVAAFKAHQRAWAKWGLIINGIFITLIIISLAARDSDPHSKRVSSVTPSSTPSQETNQPDTSSPSSPASPSMGQPPEANSSNESVEVPKEYDWVAVVRSVKGDIFYLDRNSLTSNRDSIRFWSQHVPKGENETFDQTYIQADCSSRAYEIKKILVYKNGDLVYKNDPRNIPASRAEPESVMEALIKKACSLY